MLFNTLFNRKGKGGKKAITIQEILKGTVVGRMQSVGYMQVIPLLSDVDDKRFVSPDEIKVSTSGYGSLVFENTTDQLFIVPTHVGYIVKQRAQDHAMAHTALVAQKKQKTFDTAMCVQQSQGGYIAAGKHKMLILPFSLREVALSKRKEKNYNKLWDEISKFNANLGAQTHGHLEYFLKKFKKELDQFVAEFETVPRQVGAIILLDGEVVGIERTPSYAYWQSIWGALIRECYGSLAIEYEQAMGENKTLPKGRVAVSEEVETMAELKQALLAAEAETEAMAKEKVRNLLQDKFQREPDEKVGNLIIETLQHNQFCGQIIQEEEQILYASMIVKQKWHKQKAWLTAKPFTI